MMSPKLVTAIVTTAAILGATWIMERDQAVANAPATGQIEHHAGDTKMSVKQLRTIETELEIKAPIEAVWKALTDGQELTRWFPLNAKVKPGVGGSIWVSWGAPFEGESKIEAWEPNRHLRTGWPFTSSPDGDPTPLTVDYHLESRGGSTVLRLVHAGFGVGPNWDNEYDGVTRGWAFELRGLRHYLENHRGKDRRVVWVNQPTSLSLEKAISRIIGPEGRVVRGRIDGLKEGDRFRLELVGMDEPLEGIVDINRPPRSFAATLKSFNNAYLRCDMENCGGREAAWVWFSTYGLDASTADKLQKTIETNVSKALAE